MKRLEDPLFMAIQNGNIYFVNNSAENIVELHLSSVGVIFDEGDNKVIRTSVPILKILDIKKKSFLKIEAVDNYEDYPVLYRAERIFWEGDVIQEGIGLRKVKMVEKKPALGMEKDELEMLGCSEISRNIKTIQVLPPDQPKN